MGTHYQGKPGEVRALEAYIKLIRSANAVTARLEKRLTERGLTENQFGVLEMLLHLGPVVQREIGAKLFTTSGGVTQLLDQMEKKGLIRRERDTEDKRQVRVHLTPAGRKLVEELFPGHLAAIVEEFSVLSAAEQEQLATLCKRVGLHLPRAR